MNSLNIRSASGIYSVDFFENLDSLLRSLESDDGGKRLVIMDKEVARLHPKITEIPCSAFLEVEASEKLKSFPDGVNEIFNFLVQQRANKTTKVIAIGGGVIQDVATFCSSLFHRGIPWLLVPTTLLAMGDSCLGAKSSINYLGHKNQLGNFYSPGRILICPDFIQTLKSEDVYSGLAEIFKILLCAKSGLVEEMIELSPWEKTSFPFSKYMHAALSAKQVFIEEDEFDQGIRRHLNFGHTFGHATEAVSSNAIPHGYGVALGIDMANFLSTKLGLMDKGTFEKLHGVLSQNYKFTYQLDPQQTQTIFKAMKADKKFRDGVFHLVLMQGDRIGMKTIDDLELIQQSINEYLIQNNITKKI